MLKNLLGELFRPKRETARGAVSAEERLRFALGYQTSGRLTEAEAIFRAILEETPLNADAMHLLASNLMLQRRHNEAAALLERVTSLQPECAEAYYNLAGALSALGKYDQAVLCFNRVLALKPDFVAALSNLGNTQKAAGRLDEAELSYRRALALRPDFAEVEYNLGTLLHFEGRSAEAISCYEQALRIKPDYVEAHSNLVMARDYTAYGTAHIEERWRWNEQQVKRRGIIPRPPNVVANPERKLRIGYVSADLRRHAAASCFGLMLLYYDRSLYEIVCYSNSWQEDDLTARFRDSVTHWRLICGMPDENVADMIRADGIDILVDLSGHSEGNRLLVFAGKPASVQLSAWGYPNGTGLEAMDYLLTDAVSIPPEQQPYYRERLVYLPCATAYMLPSEAPLAKRLPASEAGHITFGFFNNYVKMSEEALALWAELLGALPEATIVFKGKAFTHDERCRRRVLKRFADAGASVQRIRFLGTTSWKEHMEALSDVDIALDPFPYAGGVSTLEALWMGVPVVTLKGVALVTRGTSAAILTALGLTDWIAETPQQYLEIVRQKACSIDELKILRRTLRERLRTSPIMDPQVYVRAVETVYRQIWRKRCEQS